MEDRKLTVRAVERALDILLCFTTRSDLGLTEIASQIGFAQKYGSPSDGNAGGEGLRHS